MTNGNTFARTWRGQLTALGAGILLSVLGVTAAQAAGAPAAQQVDQTGRGGSPPEVYGRIQTMPQSGLIGQWTIGGNVYTTVAQTEFDQEDGAFAPGVCVKLDLRADGVTVREIDSEWDNDCNRNDYDYDGDHDGDDGDGDGDDREFYGVVEDKPADAYIGQWVISGSVYTVTAQTKIEQRADPMKIGDCVEVELTRDGSAVRELQAKRAANCLNGNSDPSRGRGELSGPIVSFPAGPSYGGEWQVGGTTVTADANTKFEQHRGSFAVGAYVEVEFRIQPDGTFLAREIETIRQAAGG